MVSHRPGFNWDARILIMPGLPVHVHDAYVAGEGIMHAAVLGLVSMVNQRGTGDLAQGELIRFFNIIQQSKWIMRNSIILSGILSVMIVVGTVSLQVGDVRAEGFMHCWSESYFENNSMLESTRHFIIKDGKVLKSFLKD